MDALRIQVPHELFAPAESSHFEGSIAIPVMKAGPDLYDFAGPLAWQADISNTGDALLVTGTVEARPKPACARCLDEVSFPVTGEIEGYFLLDETKAAPRIWTRTSSTCCPPTKSLTWNRSSPRRCCWSFL